MIDVEDVLSKMNPNQKINYDRVMQKMVKVWEADQKRPTILMHTCCAPCSTYTLEYLTQYADVTVYFANSNIHPKAEYQRRAYVAQKFVHDFNENTGNHVQYLEAPMSHKNFSEQYTVWKKSRKVAIVVKFAMIIAWIKRHKWRLIWDLTILEVP